MRDWEQSFDRNRGIYDLENRAGTAGSILRQYFDNRLANNQPLIDEDLELVNLQLIQFAELIATGLDAEAPEPAHASYVGLHLGVLICRKLLKDNEFGIDYGDFYDEPTNEEISRKLHIAPQLFLQHRPNIDSLINQYVKNIEPNTRNLQLTENSAALACIHIENYLLKQVEHSQR